MFSNIKSFCYPMPYLKIKKKWLWGEKGRKSLAIFNLKFLNTYTIPVFAIRTDLFG